ncbi:MAG: 16S rRNA (cytosine(967)-C(5))-methyltransferase RsmB [Gammaproteobacteria bacterium]|nr:16S rRNA (cytosine(967)-C(5))-methyltransferase RsmB [Gammaproteobacteria bacterium]MBU2477793.1 16S rRNA (cytosine(967)-C(5))-methyltransferase RsmB [Gammaproteobacteria bacterium]
MPAETVSARTLAAKAVQQVVQEGRSLSQCLPALLAQAAPIDRSLTQELAYGVLRWHARLQQQLQQLLSHPLKAKDQDIGCLLLVGLYQLIHTAIPPHAAVHATVEAVRATGKRWAVPLANAVLRAYQRRQTELEARADAQPTSRYAHPDWLIEMLRADWPQDWQAILTANNERPPFVLRVNTRQGEVASYRAALQAEGMQNTTLSVAEQALRLDQPVAVERLPGFADGAVSVQDAAAQLAAQLLDVHAGMRVLDACAAPGGKTSHILERSPELAELVAVEIDPARVPRIEQNLQRLGLSAQIIIGDASRPDSWWDGRQFERILLDAPCSATGVIRRHPDIKSLRRTADLEDLTVTQSDLLDAMWPLLAPGGMLLYATCSVLRRENEQQIERFLQRHPDAQEAELRVAWVVDWGRQVSHGRQILPGAAGGDMDMDGFYYASLIKRCEDS